MNDAENQTKPGFYKHWKRPLIPDGFFRAPQKLQKVAPVAPSPSNLYPNVTAVIPISKTNDSMEEQEYQIEETDLVQPVIPIYSAVGSEETKENNKKEMPRKKRRLGERAGNTFIDIVGEKNIVINSRISHLKESDIITP